MCCRLSEMREKQVVCIKDGTIIGFVSDIEIDTDSGRLISVLVYGKRRCFGLLGRENDCCIGWENIEVIGEDSILVNCNAIPQIKRRSKSLIGEIFSLR